MQQEKKIQHYTVLYKFCRKGTAELARTHTCIFYCVPASQASQKPSDFTSKISQSYTTSEKKEAHWHQNFAIIILVRNLEPMKNLREGRWPIRPMLLEDLVGAGASTVKSAVKVHLKVARQQPTIRTRGWHHQKIQEFDYFGNYLVNIVDLAISFRSSLLKSF